MDPEQATSLKQLFMSMFPNDGGIVVGTVTSESPLTIKIENDEKLEISGSALLVPRNLTDYQTRIDISLAGGKSTAILISAERMGTTLTCWIPVLAKSLA